MSICIQTVLKTGTTRLQQQLGDKGAMMQHRIGGYCTRRFVESRFPVSDEEDDRLSTLRPNRIEKWDSPAQ